MPWREMLPMDQRMPFVTEYESGLFTLSELVEHDGISRPTGDQWVTRHAAEGLAGLRDRSRRPPRQPQATDPALVEVLLALRRRPPRWGAKKLLAIARRGEASAAWPSRSTVCAWLKGRGLVPSPRRWARPRGLPAAPLAPITGANEVWTTDFKGECRTGDGVYGQPLTLRDGFSRFVLRCDALGSRRYELTRPCFERAFAELGLPERIRSDNGGPFARTGVARLSRLSVWGIRLGILPERIALGHPEQNGSHEQCHAVLKADPTRPPASHAAAQQRRFGRFRREYPAVRPHEAWADAVPATRQASSPRPLPRRLPPLESPGPCEVRRVSKIGEFSWAGAPVFLSDALAGEDVAFEAVADRLWTIQFASVVVGRFDERQRRIQRLAPVTVGRSASGGLRA